MPPQTANDLEFTENLRRARDVSEIHLVCRLLTERMGFEYFIYGVRIPVSFTQPYHFCISGFPKEWRKRYDSMSYLKIDPTVKHAFSSVMPIFWDDIDRSSATVRQFFSEAASYGLCHGLSAPVYGARGDVAVFSMSRADPLPANKKFRINLQTRLHWYASLVHEAVRKTVLARDGTPLARNNLTPLVRNNLTSREKDCLMWVADGKTSAEIARTLSISVRTVLFHIENAGNKLGVSGRHNIVARASALGEIQLHRHALGSIVNLPATHEATTH